MSSLKRKRPHYTAPNKAPLKSVHRATRHTSDAPLVYTADPEPRRRRTRRPDAAISDEHTGAEVRDDGQAGEERRELKTIDVRGRPPAPTSAAPAPAAPPTQTSASGRSQQRRPVLQATNQSARDTVLKPARSLRLRHRHRHDHDQDGDGHASTCRPVQPMLAEPSADLRTRGSAAGPPAAAGSQPRQRSIQKHPPPPLPPQQQMPSNVHRAAPMTQLPSRSVRIPDHVPANSSKPFLQAPTNSTQRSQKPARKTQQQPGKDQKKPNTTQRNIDKVVFGNICFSTWYHSPYGTEALGDVSGNSVKPSNSSNGPSPQDGSSKDDGIGNTTTRKTKEDRLDRLYVCPCCFKYSKELVPWWQHVRQCERRGHVPGKKIYTHPKGQQARSGAAPAQKVPGRKRKAADSTAQPAEETIQDQGEWSVWEVNGEEDGLFCQNLSLFAKLFLDNKSVFFDVAGFNYFLLVHTTPRLPPPQDAQDTEDQLPSKHQIVGFFSKEKLSWDNNNLACILIFPPWQRKGLGALLMGVSYEISRREGVLGGPEKPISDLGKRGYKRFWAGEIARWILGLDISGPDEVVVDANECSRATWIVAEDCLMILREMGIVEEAGLGPPKPVERGTPPQGDGDDGEEKTPVVNGEKEKEKQVPRVRISKGAVWDWVMANGISLEKACNPDGFIEGYAVKKISVEADEE